MDFITDQSGRHLLRLDTLVTVPDFVKQANIDLSVTQNLPRAAFADQVRREFPISTPAGVFLSYGYCKSAGIKDVRIVERIKQAADKFGIVKDTIELIDAAFSQAKKASSQQSDQTKYAITLDFETESRTKAGSVSGVRGFYPINNTEETRMSAQDLDNHKGRLPLSLYVEGAREIVKAATAYGIDNALPARILQYGTEHFPDYVHIEKEASRRVQLTGDSTYIEIAKSASANEEGRLPDDYAQLWELLDTRNEVNYSNSVPDPYRIFNVGLNKAAYDAQLRQHALLAGAAVPISAIAEADPGAIRKLFPKAAADNIENLIKAARALNSVESDDVAVLVGNLTPAVEKAFLSFLIA